MTSIIGVHGIGNYRAGHAPTAVAQHLATVWGDALGRDLTVAYYAHHLRKPGAQGADEDNVDEDIRAWLDLWDLDPGIRQGLGTMPLRQAIGIVAQHCGYAVQAVEPFVKLFFGEVHRYVNGNTPQRTAARAEVATAIAATAAPRIVLAHSLGSVVAYEALTAYPQIGVDLLVTMGSPLAMPHVVFDRLDPKPRDGMGTRPPNVKRWINLADKGDLIAIPRHGIGKQFHGVAEDLEATVHWGDFHLAAHYLRTDALASVIQIP